jgi:hypothetical protein
MCACVCIASSEAYRLRTRNHQHRNPTRLYTFHGQHARALAGLSESATAPGAGLNTRRLAAAAARRNANATPCTAQGEWTFYFCEQDSCQRDGGPPKCTAKTADGAFNATLDYGDGFLWRDGKYYEYELGCRTFEVPDLKLTVRVRSVLCVEYEYTLGCRTFVVPDLKLTLSTCTFAKYEPRCRTFKVLGLTLYLTFHSTVERPNLKVTW